MAQQIRKIPVGIKIFGTLICMLVLLILSSYVNYGRVKKVSGELVEIADFGVPIGNQITIIETRALEQDIHLERAWRHAQTGPAGRVSLESEQAQFEGRSRRIGEVILTATQLATSALEHTQDKRDIIALSRVLLTLENIKKEHREYHDCGLAVFKRLGEGAGEAAHLLQDTLEQEAEDVDAEIDAARRTLAENAERSARTAAGQEQDALHTNLIVVGVAAGIGLLFASLLTIGLTRPVANLLGGTREVHQGNLDVQVRAISRDEIGELTDFFNTMVRGIRQKDLIKATFGRYLDPRIVDYLIQKAGTDANRADRRTVTAFCSDVAGFSTISEMLTPDGLVRLINQYLTLAVEPIVRSDGIIDKFIGDAVIAFWGPPYAGEHTHAVLACRAALEQFDQLEKLRRRLPDLMGFRRGLPEIHIRVGLATGSVLVGNVGPEHIRSYTILGPTPHLAERLEEAGKTYGTRILIAEETQKQAQPAVETRKIDLIRTDGNGPPAPIYELLCLKGELAPDTAEMRDIFEEGLDLYRNQDWDRAQERLETCLKIRPDDAPTGLYLRRITHLRANPPGNTWDGVWT